MAARISGIPSNYTPPTRMLFCLWCVMQPDVPGTKETRSVGIAAANLYLPLWDVLDRSYFHGGLGNSCFCQRCCHATNVSVY